ncbi:MAG: calcium/sodium antiporter [Bacteroidetes bacterium]|nr:calcium/sodium antiporter [Bacteroidota bacterium]
MIIYILFILGFAILIKGADMLVDGSSSLARRFGISDIVIGLTIVSMGTSAPELVVNVIASLNGNSEIAVGNILGSNIVNIFFILGISAVIFPLTVKRNTTYKEIPFALLASLVILFLCNDMLFDYEDKAVLSTGDGLVLLGFFSIFIYYIFAIAKAETLVESYVAPMPLPKAVLFIAIGLIGLVLGGKWIVDGAVVMASGMGVSESLIGLTIVAIGTSLPELATSAVAAYKKNTDIAIGNVVGSNIFNSFWILGFSALINPIPVLQRNNIDFAMNILASVLLFAFLFIGKRHMLERWQGVAFILVYIAYVVYLVQLG